MKFRLPGTIEQTLEIALPSDDPGGFLRRAALGYDFETRAARHEAGHAIGFYVGPSSRFQSISDITISPTEAERARGAGGIVRREGYDPNGPDPRETEKPIDRALRDPEPGDHDMMALAGAPLLAGIAAEFPTARGIRLEAEVSGHDDRRDFAGVMTRLFGLRWPPECWHWPSVERAQRIVDAHWGCVLAVAAGLLQHQTLTRDQVANLIENAKPAVNRRPEW